MENIKSNHNFCTSCWFIYIDKIRLKNLLLTFSVFYFPLCYTNEGHSCLLPSHFFLLCLYVSCTYHILDVHTPNCYICVHLICVNCQLSVFHSYTVRVHHYAVHFTFIVCFISHVILLFSSQYLLKNISALSVSSIFASLLVINNLIML